MVSPVIETLSKKYQGKATVAKINVDHYSKVAQRYGIMHIPVLLFLNDGQMVDRVAAPVPQQFLSAKIDDQLF